MKKIVLMLLSFCLLWPFMAWGGPADVVYTPHIERGEAELSVQYGTSSSNAGPRPQAGSIGLGYGVTDTWFSEAYLKQKQGAAGTRRYAEWENRFALNGEGMHAVDFGIVTELELPLDAGGVKEVRLGAMFQSRIDQLQLNANVILERAYGGVDEDSLAQVVNIGYQWQMRQRKEAGIDLGIQGLGELGKWNDWLPAGMQSHRLGPALFAKLGEELKLNAAWLFGISTAAADYTMRLQLEYEL